MISDYFLFFFKSRYIFLKNKIENGTTIRYSKKEPIKGMNERAKNAPIDINKNNK